MERERTMEFTLKDLAKRSDIQLIDIRNEETRRYGTIPGAIAMTREEILEAPEKLPEGRIPVFFCIRGTASEELCEELEERGIEAGSLAGGYNGWLMSQMESGVTGEKSREEIEDSIRKTYKRSLFTRFAKAVANYELVEPGDKIAVCISGGKDSMLMAKLFQELKRHNKIPFELVFLVMDPGYNAENRKVIEHNAEHLGIPVTVFETQIFEAVYEIEKSPCYLCARMRRGYLYSNIRVRRYLFFYRCLCRRSCLCRLRGSALKIILQLTFRIRRSCIKIIHCYGKTSHRRINFNLVCCIDGGRSCY